MLKSPRIYIYFLFMSTFSKVTFKILRKLVWLGDLYIIPAVKGVVLYYRISKKIFSITFGKKPLSTRN